MTMAGGGRRATGDGQQSAPEYFRAPAEWSASDGNGFETDSGHGHHEHAPYQPVFGAGSARKKELDELLTRYPTKMAALLPALWMVQHERGWVSDEGMAEVAQLLDLTPAYVKGVVTFYTLFNTQPVGKHQVWVCRTLSCALNGSDEILRHCEKRLGVHAGETSKDGLVTLRTAECLASCGSAPMMQVNREYHENLTTDDVDRILDGLRG